MFDQFLEVLGRLAPIVAAAEEKAMAAAAAGGPAYVGKRDPAAHLAQMGVGAGVAEKERDKTPAEAAAEALAKQFADLTALLTYEVWPQMKLCWPARWPDPAAAAKRGSVAAGGK